MADVFSVRIPAGMTHLDNEQYLELLATRFKEMLLETGSARAHAERVVAVLKRWGLCDLGAGTAYLEGLADYGTGYFALSLFQYNYELRDRLGEMGLPFIDRTQILPKHDPKAEAAIERTTLDDWIERVI